MSSKITITQFVIRDKSVDCARLLDFIGKSNAEPITIDGALIQDYGIGELKFLGFSVVLEFESTGEEELSNLCLFDFLGQ